MTDEELLEELTALAEDFDSLSDDARDDMLFIYEWKAPVWMDYYPDGPIGGPYTYPGPERAVVVAAMLREAIRKLK